MIDTTINKLETYMKERALLPDDSDGIYVIVEGGAKLYNKQHKDITLKQMGKNEYFGESKFLSQQGYSYFGAIEACAVADPSEKEVKAKKRPSLKSGIDDKIVTTCMFLPSHKFYLIPFYDLMRLRDNKKAKKRVQKIRDECQKRYRDNIRNLNKHLQGGQ